MNLDVIRQVFPIIEQLSDTKLAESIASIWMKALKMSNWKHIEDACFSPVLEKGIRLVDHVNVTTTIASVEMAKLINKYQGEEFDLDRIIALGLLHDVSKLLEYTPDEDGGYKRSEIGEKIQHGFFGALLAHEEGLSTEMLHLILTHTPQSKMKPQYKEAVLFSHMDLCDADILFYGKNVQR